MNYEIVHEQTIADERGVEGLIMLCKEMAGKSMVDKVALLAIPFDMNVVLEAKSRIIKYPA